MITWMFLYLTHAMETIWEIFMRWSEWIRLWRAHIFLLWHYLWPLLVRLDFHSFSSRKNLLCQWNTCILESICSLYCAWSLLKISFSRFNVFWGKKFDSMCCVMDEHTACSVIRLGEVPTSDVPIIIHSTAQYSVQLLRCWTIILIYIGSTPYMHAHVIRYLPKM